MIKFAKSPEIEQIKANAVEQEEKVVNTLSSTTPNIVSTAPTPFSLKGNNQRSIALAHNLVFQTYMKYQEIQYHYIHYELALEKIDLQYMPTLEIIVDRMIKALTNTKI